MTEAEDLVKFARPNIERSIISLCFKQEQMIEIKNQNIDSEMFLIPANKYIFQAIDYLFQKKQEPTPVAITEVLKDKHAKKIVENFGGIEYLQLLMEQKANKNSVEILCEKLKQAYTKKELYLICEEQKNFLTSDKTEVLNPNELTNTVEEKILELTNKVQKTTDIYKMGDGVEEILESRSISPSEIPGLQTGWSKFDKYTNGAVAGDLIMVCARAKTGKSTILTNWAVKLSIEDKLPILYIDTEMDSRQQEDRILSIISGIPQREIISGMYVQDTEAGLAVDKIKKIKEAVQKIKDGNYYHIYLPSFTMEQVIAIARKFKARYNISALFFDYLKMPLSSISTLKNAKEYQMLGFLASGLKDLAGTLKIPIYSACQENRSDPKGNTKSELNVAGSDRILQLATKLIFLSNKSEEEIIVQGEINGNQKLYIAYQRNGQSDVPPINIYFNKETLKQEEV